MRDTASDKLTNVGSGVWPTCGVVASAEVEGCTLPKAFQHQELWGHGDMTHPILISIDVLNPPMPLIKKCVQVQLQKHQVSRMVDSVTLDYPLRNPCVLLGGDCEVIVIRETVGYYMSYLRKNACGT